MGRLFWKFLVAYWVALLLTVVSIGATAWVSRLAAEEVGPSLEVGGRAAFLMGRAERDIRAGGEPALRERLDRWSRFAPVILFAVDAEGRDLLGRRVPSGALDLARSLAISDERPDVVRRVTGPDGETFLLFVPLTASPLWEQLLFAGRPLPRGVPLAAGVLTSLVFGVLLAWYVARPIHHLRGAFEALSLGHFETRVSDRIGRRRDEVADLGRDFDGMARQLQTLMAAQRSLLHDVSHELRSPLARLQAAIGLARQDPEKLEASLDRIESEATRLDDLVGQALTLSRLEAGVAGAFPLGSERTDVGDLVAAIVSDADFEARSGDRNVRFRGEGELVADVRVELLHRAVENVVRNAVKHTAPGTAVEVDATHASAADELVVTVADRGPGVDHSELESIFEPFYRGTEGQSARGFGLGLAIARRAVEAHGGRVRASNRDGGGLVVEMRLPPG